ncbi:hypothetical protein GY45DRAFT_1372004 [Cubamyces sp. BRFM 1775]|nr:hypothetical protein GY45DRAFT_1372004 [Cubamyces sp. BRFM 1775]
MLAIAMGDLVAILLSFHPLPIAGHKIAGWSTNMPSEEISNAHAGPYFALLEYARNMHQYTLELWLELSKKLDAQGHFVPPELRHGHPHNDEGGHDDGSHDAARSDGASDIDAESPQE